MKPLPVSNDRPSMCPEQPHSQKRESGYERRAAVALAARAIIIEKGLEGLRTRDIAERVGINIATLHYHVPTKEALVALVAESLRDDFKAQALRHPKAGLNGADQLRQEFNEFRETVDELPELIGVLSELVDRARRDKSIADIILPMQAYWTEQFAKIFRVGMEDGSFRKNIDAGSAA
ncbi:MAG: TetR/AcrR family transcriptional regulator, partial [Hyphomicrobiales bacterium]